MSNAAASRPVVGITTYEDRARWGDWEQLAELLPASYVRSVERAGAVPILIPVQDITAGDAANLVSRLDGLIVAGGPDVEPARYGAERHPETSELTESRSRRDATEMALIEAVTARPIPTLAICRGMQLLNVARGGSLVQHLPDVVEGEHGGTPGGFGSHIVQLQGGSLLAKAAGWERTAVPTRHHQAIDPAGIGRDLLAVAFADDGTIEAVEDRGVPFLIGVQWHPEAGEDPSLFVALAEAARSAMVARPDG